MRAQAQRRAVDPNSPEAGTMQAVVQDGYGTAEVLRLDRVSRPEAAEGEVLVRVHAAGLDRGAWHLMTGRPYLLRLAFGLRRPRNPVFGIGPGSFAEYAVAREDKLAHKPANASFEQSAAVAVSALTALQALETGRVGPGQHVLVTGASGGVGSYAVQLAKALGAEVTGVCSTAKLDLVWSLGADHVIDRTGLDFADGGHRYDVILDIAGNPSLSRLRRALTPTGTAVLVGGEEGGGFSGGMNRQLRALAVSPFLRQRLTMVLCKETSTDLERLADLVAAGRVTPSIGRTYSLAQVPEAMRDLEAGRVHGKAVVTVR
jgi:NADPH:quinone reductase-like Zn-dependent oxidoreductase